MAIIDLQKGSEKLSKVRKKSGNLETDIDRQPCKIVYLYLSEDCLSFNTVTVIQAFS